MSKHRWGRVPNFKLFNRHQCFYPLPNILISSFIWKYGLKSSSILWLLSMREPLQFLLATLPSSGILLQWPEVQFDFTSGNSSKEKSNNVNLMGDMSEKKHNNLKSGINLWWKTSQGVFPPESLETLQWMWERGGGQAKERWSKGDVVPCQGQLLTKYSWTQFQISEHWPIISYTRYQEDWQEIDTELFSISLFITADVVVIPTGSSLELLWLIVYLAVFMLKCFTCFKNLWGSLWQPQMDNVQWEKMFFR